MDSDDEHLSPEDAAAQALKELPSVIVRKNELREDLFQKLQVMCVQAIKDNKLQKDIAQQIKQKLDKDADFNELVGKGPWQVIVGRSFASSLTHESMHMSFFDIPMYQETFLVYKSLGVQAA